MSIIPCCGNMKNHVDCQKRGKLHVWIGETGNERCEVCHLNMSYYKEVTK